MFAVGGAALDFRFTMTAPSTPGAYYIGYYMSRSKSCAEALTTAWPAEPSYLGVVAVW